MCSSSFPMLCSGFGFVVYGFMFIWQKNNWGDLESCSFVYNVVLLEREKCKMLWGERAAHDTVEQTSTSHTFSTVDFLEFMDT